MVCIFCKGNLKTQKVEEEVRVEENHVLVTVEADVCESCKERYFSEETVSYLQELKRKLKTSLKNFKQVGQVLRAA